LLVWEGVKPLEGEWKLPYPIKGKPLDSIYELQWFWDNSKDLYGKKVGNEEYPGLLELVTVHSTGKININTAPYWVLRALSPYIDDVLARQIMEKREEQPFKDVMELLTVDGIDMDLLYKIQDLLTTKSRFFKITLTLEGDNSQTLTVIYDREKNQIVEKSVQ
jgi:general secretion pathway protein K